MRAEIAAVKGEGVVDAYIAAQDVDGRERLKVLRALIRKAAPAAEETFSYGMPAYRHKGILCYFAGFKSHYSFFTRPAYLSRFSERLQKFSTSKSAIRIPYSTAVPAKLITDIVKFAVKENEARTVRPARG